MGSKKYIHFFFACAAVLVAYLASLAADWILGFFVSRPSQLTVTGIGVVAGLIAIISAYRSSKIQEGITEIFAELEKVTWPTRKETSAATVVVIVTVAIASIILSLFDALWSVVTRTVLG